MKRDGQIRAFLDNNSNFSAKIVLIDGKAEIIPYRQASGDNSNSASSGRAGNGMSVNEYIINNQPYPEVADIHTPSPCGCFLSDSENVNYLSPGGTGAGKTTFYQGFCRRCWQKS